MDVKAINKLYKSLKVPKEFYNPTKLPFDKCAIMTILSDRQRGKTTNILLWALCAYVKCGIITQYVRSTEDMITPKKLGNLFNTIRQYRRNDGSNYIEFLSDGVYNDIILLRRKWYLIYRDENGGIEHRDTQHFMYTMDCEHSESYKSTYNDPNGDIIIFDEFCGKIYRQNEFVYFMDVVKTCFSNRDTCYIFMLSNTIDSENQYFYEMEIMDDLREMDFGERRIVTTDAGTNVCVEVLDNDFTPHKIKSNQRYFGFKNPLLSSITGSKTWAVEMFPHLARGTAYNVTASNIYLYANNRYCRLELFNNEDLGTCVNCYFVDKFEMREDTLIYSTQLDHSKNVRYATGSSKFDRFIWGLYRDNKFFYVNNYVGRFVQNYYHQR